VPVGSAPESAAARGSAEHDLGTLTWRFTDLADEPRCADVERDQRDLLCFHVRREGVIDHPAIPGTPAERSTCDVTAATHPLALAEGGQGLIRHRVVDLTFVAGAPGDRRERDEGTQRLIARRVEERTHAEHLGVEHEVELGVGLLRDTLVGDHAGTMNETGDRAEL